MKWTEAFKLALSYKIGKYSFIGVVAGCAGAIIAPLLLMKVNGMIAQIIMIACAFIALTCGNKFFSIYAAIMMDNENKKK